MTTVSNSSPTVAPIAFPRDFANWRAGVIERNTLPIIAVAGSRGKTTVVRLLETMFRAAGLRVATWTDAGVEIRGRKQVGEIGPWSRVGARLQLGTLDIGIQELDWATIHAVGLPFGVYPIVAVTNLCANSDACLVRDETRVALRSVPKLFGSVTSTGTIVLNGEDYAISGQEVTQTAPVILTGLRRESPLLRQHYEDGGFVAWTDKETIFFGDQRHQHEITRVATLDFALGGSAHFQLLNALTAISVAQSVGIPVEIIEEALAGLNLPASRLPGSFNLTWIGDALAIVDRPAPSWFLRPIIRAASQREQGRLVVVIGPLDELPQEDIQDLGRLVGRSADVVIHHTGGQQTTLSESFVAFRTGMSLADVPPVVVRLPTERQAVGRALRSLRADDTLLVLAREPAAVLTNLRRASSLDGHPHYVAPPSTLSAVAPRLGAN